jgi:hypothetical protein
MTLDPKEWKLLAQRSRRIGLSLAAAMLLALTASAPARADAVTDWNAHAAGALTARQAPTVWTLHLAMVHGAVYDAVNSIDGRHEPYLVKVRARRWYSQDAAAATAAHRVLTSLLPDQQSSLDSLYAASLGGISAGRARDGGVAVGEISAAAMLAARANDGRFPATPFRFPAPASAGDAWPVGQWRPTLPLFANDPSAWVKDVDPFLIEDPTRFGSAGPNDLGSGRYAREFDEVKELGSLGSAARSGDQTDMARFWAEGPAIWTRIARQLGTAHGLDQADNARLFAMLYLTGADAIISCWQDKARWLFRRPITAIREAGRDGNSRTEADPTWVPLVNSPPYPDHPSGLTCVGAAYASTLGDFLGTDKAEFSATSSISNSTRSFAGFAEAVDEMVDARVYSGIHFRTADVHGARIGEQIAGYRERHYFRPERGW